MSPKYDGGGQQAGDSGKSCSLHPNCSLENQKKQVFQMKSEGSLLGNFLFLGEGSLWLYSGFWLIG